MRRRDVLRGIGAGGGLIAAASYAPGACAAPGSGRWYRLQGANFIVYSSTTQTGARKQFELLEGFHTLLTRLIPGSPNTSIKLPVYFAESEHDFQASHSGFRQNVSGFYSPATEEIRAVVATSRSRESQTSITAAARASDSTTVLFHEYVHHFMFANLRAAYPPWYIEGMADFLSTAVLDPKGVYVGMMTRGRAYMLTKGDWIPLDKMLTATVWDFKDEDDQAKFYSQGWLMTHFLFNRPDRSKGFDRYVNAMTAGKDPRAAFEPAFGISIAAFEKELKDYGGGDISYHLLPAITVDTSGVVTERLPEVADELLIPTSFIRSRPKPKEAEPALGAIRTTAKKYRGDAYANRALATAEVWSGDLNVARPLLDDLLAREPDNAETQHLSGLCTLRAGYAAKDKAMMASAAASFAAAQRLDPNRPSSLYRYVECKTQGGAELDKHLLDILLAAYQLAPQVEPISLSVAQGLMLHKRFEEAALVLHPLAGNPHGGDASKMAQAALAVAAAEKSVSFVIVDNASNEPDATQ